MFISRKHVRALTTAAFGLAALGDELLENPDVGRLFLGG